jgi:multiple sugar transport system substrate-binding protein
MRRHARTTRMIALLGAGALALTACGGSGFDDDSETAADGGDAAGDDGGDDGGDEGAGEDTGEALTVLIGSSGDAETDAVTAAVAEWSEESGTEARVQVASDLNQELSQGFAGGSPPDVFYTSTDLIGGYVEAGSLYPYGDQLSNADDFYDTLRENFTIDDTFYCAPKDFSTLALIIDTDAWEEAGLTDDDIPTDWEGLASVAETLTTDSQVGLSFGPEYQRVGVFMAQAGGGLVSDDGNEAIADSQENVEALTFVQGMLQDGTLAYPSEIGTGWGGEAFGSGAAAMTIEGNWINGALQADFPDVNYQVVELPEGPAGKATMQFTNCWGIAADSPNQGGAVSLVEHLTSTESQATFAEAFGVMPSVESAADDFAEIYPEQTAFLDGTEYAIGLPTEAGANDVIGDFNGQIEGLESGDPEAILSSVQSNLQPLLGSDG